MAERPLAAGTILSNAGYRVRTAPDAVVAVRMVLRAPPDLILADSERRVEQALSRGAQAYLTKPILVSRLLAVVAEQLCLSPLPPSAGRPAFPRGRSAA